MRWRWRCLRLGGRTGTGGRGSCRCRCRCSGLPAGLLLWVGQTLPGVRPGRATYFFVGHKEVGKKGLEERLRRAPRGAGGGASSAAQGMRRLGPPLSPLRETNHSGGPEGCKGRGAGRPSVRAATVHCHGGSRELTVPAPLTRVPAPASSPLGARLGRCLQTAFSLVNFFGALPKKVTRPPGRNPGGLWAHRYPSKNLSLRTAHREPSAPPPQPAPTAAPAAVRPPPA